MLAPPPHLCLNFFNFLAWRSSRKKAQPAKTEDVVDLSSKFGMSFGSDSDSSDAEFAPENEAIDSDGMGIESQIGRLLHALNPE